ncbi:efflux transporter outer membrane subunit [Microbulbifer variabilis]|uniref:Efflux transporter outer membrane subunit n=1 Tax=Microbulbifer variabilis TaxID=266805 RepID=A0ABY4VGT8_9GAMM|nr:efflux transporter outer membrane subunit [Microbulbifer variabilis]USD23399.1 efflux transporter outer membrane subunit [Microbulbifer variabilis]
MGFYRVLAICVPLLASCSSQPLETVEPQDILSLPQTFSASGTEAADVRWWRGFEDPQLDQLVELSLRDNPSLQASYWRLRQAAAAARGARSGLFPRVTAQIENTEQRYSSGEFTDPSNEGNSWSTRIAASYELDLWGRVRAGASAAEAGLQAQQQNLQTAALSLAAEVSSTWLQLCEQWGQHNLLLQQLEINRKSLRVLESRFARGVSDAADVLQQRQLVQRSEQELEQTGADIEVLKVQLATLLGVNPDQLTGYIHKEASLPFLPALPDTGIPSQLLLRRPDVREAQRKLVQDYHLADQAWADRLPVLSLSAVASNGTSLISDITENWLLAIAASLEGVIFDGGALSSARQQQDAALQERWALYRETVNQALSEVEQALIREGALNRELEHLRERKRLSDLIVQRRNRAYTRGAVDFLNLLTATTEQQSLAREVLSAERQLLQNRVTLYRALSGGLPQQDLPEPEPADLELYLEGNS